MDKNLQFVFGHVSFRILFSIVLFLLFNSAFAQDDYRYFGLAADFGVKSTTLSSDLVAIDGMDVGVEGGSLGFVAGNEVLKSRFRVAGFYYSSSKVRHSVNIFASGAAFNIYPIKVLNKSRQALNPYVSGGIDYNNLKFRGYYVSTTPDRKTNYSRSSAPYIGRIGTVGGTAGVGLEWRLPYEYDFVHLFAEARYTWIFRSKADEVLKNTRAENPTSINIGVSFGFLR